MYYLVEILRLSLWLSILVTLFVPLERLFAVHPKKVLRKGIGTDFVYYFISSLIPAMILSIPVGLLAWSVHRIVPQGILETTGSWPLWARTIVGLIAGELGYYWGHRWSHEDPFLWRFHSIHHSAEEIDFLVNTRAHPIDMVFSRFCGLVPIYLLGLGGPTKTDGGSEIPVLVTLIGTLWGFFVHANLRWRFGPLEWLISTPAFHHWHHTTKPVNKNYSSTLPWLDWVFGTHHLPKEWPDAYGIKAKLPDSIAGQLVYPLLLEPPDQTDAQEPPRSEPAISNV